MKVKGSHYGAMILIGDIKEIELQSGQLVDGMRETGLHINKKQMF